MIRNVIGTLTVWGWMLSCGGFALAETTTPPTVVTLTLAQALDLGLKNNLDLQADNLLYEEKKNDDASSWNVFVPKVTLSGSAIQSLKSSSELQIPDTDKLLPRTVAQGSLDAEWSFHPALLNSVRQTKLEYQRGTLSLALAKLRLTRDIKKLYSALVLNRASTLILEETLTQARARLSQAQAQVNAGSGTALAVLSEEVNVANAELPLADQEDQAISTQANLRALLGLAPGVKVEPAWELPTHPTPQIADGTATLSEARRLDLATLANQLDSLQNRVDGAALALVPTFFVRMTLDPLYQKDLFKPEEAQGRSLNELWKMNSGNLILGLTIPVDALVPGSTRMRELAQSQAALQAGKLRYTAAQNAARTEVATLGGELRRIELRRQVSEKTITLAESLYVQTQRAFDAGSRTRLDLQDALTKRNGARFEVIKDQYLYSTKLADLEYALAGGDFASGSDRM